MANNRRARPMSSIDTSNNRNEARHGPWKRTWPSPVEQRTDWGIAISLQCPPSTWNAIRLRNDIRVLFYPPPTLSSIALLPSPFLFRLRFFPNIARARYPFELKFSLIASRFTFGCLTFIFDSPSPLPTRNLVTLRSSIVLLRRVFYLWRVSN